MDLRFYQKIKIFEIQNFNKIKPFTISFLFFQHFWHFVFYLTYPNLSKNYGIFCSVFIGRIRDFTNNFWKILKVLLKKILICEIFFFQYSAVYYQFFYFFIIFDILFSISSICTCQQILDFFMFFCFMDQTFWKIMEYFSKKYKHLKSKILHKFHRLLFVFSLFFYQFCNLFFSYFTYSNLSKNSKHFCAPLLYGLQILSKNSGKFLNFY